MFQKSGVWEGLLSCVAASIEKGYTLPRWDNQVAFSQVTYQAHPKLQGRSYPPRNGAVILAPGHPYCTTMQGMNE